MLNCVHGAKHHHSVKQETPERRRIDVFLKISRGFLGCSLDKDLYRRLGCEEARSSLRFNQESFAFLDPAIAVRILHTSPIGQSCNIR